MQITYDYDWIPITKEEYEKHAYKRKDDSLLEIITETLSELECYRKVPIYEGLQNIIDNNPKYYKYYKRGGFKTSIICSEENYNKLMKMYGNIQNV